MTLVIDHRMYTKLDYIPESQLIRLEELTECDRAIARLLVGTSWRSDTGVVWHVVAHDDRDGYVCVERDGRADETYWWHVKSILETTMVRVAC